MLFSSNQPHHPMLTLFCAILLETLPLVKLHILESITACLMLGSKTVYCCGDWSGCCGSKISFVLKSLS